MKALFTVGGKVRVGAKRGKLLGFPTANLSASRRCRQGVYASKVTVEGKIYFAATFVGVARTFAEKEFRVESFIFGFDGDIYGKFIYVRFYKFIRGNKKFRSSDELVAQMKKDVTEIKEFFSKET